MNVIRQIDVFDKLTEGLVDEIPLDRFEIEVFRRRFNAKPEDPLMYDPYEVTSETIDLFPNIKFDFAKYSYTIACYQAPQ